MFAKLLTAMVIVVVIGACLFSLRQQRLELMHEVTDLHRQMNRDRQATWDSQVRIAERTQPEALREALIRTGIEMEPAVSENPSITEAATPLVDARHERR